MTAAVVGVFVHPKACPVCGGAKRVTMRAVVKTEMSLLGQNSWPWVRRPAKLALVIDCPQCVGAEELSAGLPRAVPGSDGAA